eukprot:4903462-Pyramimonas_sp.AAC.1
MCRQGASPSPAAGGPSICLWRPRRFAASFPSRSHSASQSTWMPSLVPAEGADIVVGLAEVGHETLAEA